MCVVYIVKQYPLSSSRLCPLPWEFAERKCNFWLVPRRFHFFMSCTSTNMKILNHFN
ncbi:hypothetical protein ACFW04_003632 [Cataglyphis niger]